MNRRPIRIDFLFLYAQKPLEKDPSKLWLTSIDRFFKIMQIGASMPTICEFFGILIRMYYDDHNPPHFHAYYGGEEAVISIDTLELMEGSLPRRAKALVIEWAIDHRQDLLNDWKLAEQHQPLNRIEPLE